MLQEHVTTTKLDKTRFLFAKKDITRQTIVHYCPFSIKKHRKKELCVCVCVCVCVNVNNKVKEFLHQSQSPAPKKVKLSPNKQ